MIIDRIEHWESYIGLVPHYEEAVRFALTLTEKPLGRYECTSLPEGTVYAMVQEGEGQPFCEGKLEAHRRYLDMQIMLEGGETVGYAEITGLPEAVPYDREKDIGFYDGGGQPVQIRKGMFYLVLPQDGHMPSRALEGEKRYRKIVLKIRLDNP
mgnify:CR=1 FL=1